MAKFHVRTVKLKLRITDEDKDNSWKHLRQISNDAWRAANWIVTGQYMNDQMMRRVYARFKIDTKDKEARSQAEENFFFNFFGSQRQATTEKDIKAAFPELPPCVTNPLNRVVYQSYNKEKGDMHLGNRSLRTYRKGMPIQTKKTAIQFFKTETGHGFTWKLGRSNGINFEILYGRDKANNRLTIERIFEGTNDYSAPQIQLKDKNLFLLLPVKEPERAIDLDPELSVGVDLGIAVPAYIGLSKGPARRAIGDINDFLKVRTQMQSRRRRIQRSLKSVTGGKGRTKKLKALNQIKAKETNFVRSYNHFVSREVINFAVKNRAGVIKVELLEGYGDNKDHAFFLRNWSYFELQTFVEYKAKQNGIKVVKVDPYHTSQTCSVCGHFEDGQREDQAVFKCKACGEKLNADYNAAVNIARSSQIVTKKEQCEYYKKKKETPHA